jgi:hypothetical protein
MQLVVIAQHSPELLSYVEALEKADASPRMW